MKDTIKEDDMLIDVTATQLEKQLAQEKSNRELLQERFNAQNNEMQKMQKSLEEIEKKVNDSKELSKISLFKELLEKLGQKELAKIKETMLT